MEQLKRKKCIQLSNEKAVFIAKVSIVNAIKYDNFEQIEWINFFLYLNQIVYFESDFFFWLVVRLSFFLLSADIFFCTTLNFGTIVIETFQFAMFAQLPIDFWACIFSHVKMLFKFSLKFFSLLLLIDIKKQSSIKRKRYLFANIESLRM